jgi:hypothetical protein
MEPRAARRSRSIILLAVAAIRGAPFSRSLKTQRETLDSGAAWKEQ